jgi:type VI secretion system protein VasD
MLEKISRVLTIALVAGLALGACKSSAPPKPTAVKAHLVASKDVNPRPEDGSPQPVHIRVFQLKDDSAFAAADYWALVRKSKETLGGSLVQQMQFDLAPGQQQDLELKIDPDAHVLGVVAEFAGYLNTDGHWRAISPTPESSMLDMVRKSKRIIIEIGKSSVGIRIGT